MGQEEGGSPTLRLRLPKRDGFTVKTSTGDLGGLIWNKLSPEKQAALEGPIRIIEQGIARQFPEGYASPLVARASSLPEGQLERQTDTTSCTYVATANALRVLDQPKLEYSRDALKNRNEQLQGQAQVALNAKEIENIFNSGTPYDQFALQRFEQPKLRMPQTHPEMIRFFRALQNGNIAVAGWRSSIDAIRQGGGFVEHARTIVGFSRGPNESIILHVIDPYGARQEKWSFRDWVVASEMEILDNPIFSEEEIRRFAGNMGKRGGMAAAIVSYAWVIHKKQPRLVIAKNRRAPFNSRGV